MFSRTWRAYTSERCASNYRTRPNHFPLPFLRHGSDLLGWLFTTLDLDQEFQARSPSSTLVTQRLGAQLHRTGAVSRPQKFNKFSRFLFGLCHSLARIGFHPICFEGEPLFLLTRGARDVQDYDVCSASHTGKRSEPRMDRSHLLTAASSVRIDKPGTPLAVVAAAMSLLLGASVAQAQTVERDGNTATAVQ